MIRAIIYSIFFLFLYKNTTAQSYIGLGADNFNGIHGALTNPANIADSRLKIDINLGSISAFTTNNYTETNYWKALTDSDFSFENDASVIGSNEEINGSAVVDILGPSVLISLNEKHSIGLTTRVRGIQNLTDLDGKVIDFIDGGLRDLESIEIAGVKSNLVTNTWFETGITYARVLKNNKVEFLKAGITVKYLKGLGLSSTRINNGVAFFDPNDNPDNVFLSGELSNAYSANLDLNEDAILLDGSSDSDFLEAESSGLGIDLGFVYEYRPNHDSNVSRAHVKEQKIIRHKNTYKYKLGVSILDIGAVTYKNVLSENYELNPVTRDELLLEGTEQLQSFQQQIDPLFSSIVTREKVKIKLPTSLRAEFDLLLKENFYINTTTRISLISRKNKEANRYQHQVSVSPRYETKWFTAYSPIVLTQYGGVQWGLGGRLGPLFIGSSGFFSRIFDKETRAFDIHAGIKIPIYHKTPRPPEEKEETKQLNCFNCDPVVKPSKKKNRPNGYRGKVK